MFFLRLRYSDIPTSDPFNDDFDGDKMSNYAELLNGTDPLYSTDTDGDGIPDDWETAYGLNRNEPADATQTAAGGGMTNLQHYQIGSNPNDPPPPPTITAGTATLDQSADTLLYPADDSQLLIKNGNFSAPTVETDERWDTFTGITGWTAIAGSLIELQEREVNATANAGQYCELDSHWRDGQSETDHGIQQTANLARGHYLLFFDYRGRRAGADSFIVKLQAGTASPVLLAAKNGAAATWKRGSVSFEVAGDNPNPTPITLLFDTADAADSYGAYIDNVLLLPVEFKARYQFSDFFDPPLAGDVHPPTGKKDEDDWVAWTSVARSGPYGVNERTKLVFSSDLSASMCELAVASNSTQLITVSPTALTSKETNLTITGLAGNAIEEATIELHFKGTQTVVARMRVLLLPERDPISCKFYRVHDPNHVPGDPLQPGFYTETVPGQPGSSTNNTVASAGEATAEIDSRMVQAVVSATPTAPDPPVNGDFSEKIIDYEPGEFGNGALDNADEFDVFRQKREQGVFSAECNVVYVALLDTVAGALGYVDDPASKIIFISQNSWTDHPGAELTDPEDAKGATKQMARVIAHEFGHYLEISTREAGFRTPTGGHDHGPYPGGTAPLMLAGDEGKPGRWMRHEDWRQANLVAKNRQE